VSSYPVRLPPKPTLVVGAYGYRNAGDEAILAGLLTVLGREGVTVVSRSPAETVARHGVRAVSVLGTPAALRRHRGVVIGGGGLFGRDMGLLGRLLPAFGLFAGVSGREIHLMGIGVDRHIPTLSARLQRALARRATAVTVRDQESADLLRGFGISAEARPDLSSLVPSAGRAAGLRRLRAIGLLPDRRPVIGLCLTAVDPALAKAVVAAVVGAVDALPSLDFCLIPMSRHPFVATHNDEILARRVIAACPRVHCLDEVDDPGTILGVFEALAGAVCMRYHSLLFAERAGIPIVPVPYREKAHRWVAEHGLRAIPPNVETLVAELDRARLARTA